MRCVVKITFQIFFKKEKKKNLKNINEIPRIYGNICNFRKTQSFRRRNLKSVGKFCVNLIDSKSSVSLVGIYGCDIDK